MRVLLVNDDGPPGPASPHILGLYETLRRRQPEWDIRVVLPSSQKSWGSMAFTLSPPCAIWYYYPLKGDVDASQATQRHGDTNRYGQWTTEQRPVRDDEAGEWVLVDGSPTTCTNTGLYALSSLQPQSSDSTKTRGEETGTPRPAFDLVLSGPNFGRNTGNAFSLCSGTIGAALAASLCGVKAISLSYAHFQQLPHALAEAQKQQSGQEEKTSNASQPYKFLGQLPPTASRQVVQNAHQLVCDIVARLWSSWEQNVGVYSVNVPLTFMLNDKNSVRAYWTRTWDSKFGPLYATQDAKAASGKDIQSQREAQKPAEAPPPQTTVRFAPNMASMLRPQSSAEAEGTDIWAIENGHVSIARLGASYTAVVIQETSATSAAASVGPGSLFKL